MSLASVIFYCPYCAEEDLRPLPEPSSAWRCTACTRSFVVTNVRPQPPIPLTDPPPEPSRSATP